MQVSYHETCFFLLAFLCPLPAISNVLMTFNNNMGAFFSEQTKLHKFLSWAIGSVEKNIMELHNLGPCGTT